MTQYNSKAIKFTASQLKNETEIVSKQSSNMIGNSDDGTNFPHKLLSTNRKVTNLH